MQSIIKGILITAAILYIISPVDACPGPADDIIVMLLGTAATRRLDD